MLSRIVFTPVTLLDTYGTFFLQHYISLPKTLSQRSYPIHLGKLFSSAAHPPDPRLIWTTYLSADPKYLAKCVITEHRLPYSGMILKRHLPQQVQAIGVHLVMGRYLKPTHNSISLAFLI